MALTRPDIDKSPTPNTYVPPPAWTPQDPRDAPAGTPIGVPREGRYPQFGIPYPDPDREPLEDPTVTLLEPASVALGEPDFTIHVHGTNFLPGTQILWNGAPEPTTVLSATEVVTGVNMATAINVGIVAVSVLNPNGAQSNTLPFEFLPAEPEAGAVRVSRARAHEGD